MRGLGLLLIAMGAYAQTGATFDVVTIKAAPPPTGRGMTVGFRGGPGDRDPGLWQCTNCTILMLVQQAYSVKHYQVTAPDWMASARYEIKAKVPDGATKEQFKEMLRNLLAERFKLEFHRGTKDMQVFDLVIGKGGSKLKAGAEQPAQESKDDGPPAAGRGRGPDRDSDGFPIIPKDCEGCIFMMNGKARYHSAHSTIKDFAEMIGNQMGQPITDSTGLTGMYEITLSWNVGAGLGRGRGGAPPSPNELPVSGDAEFGITIEAAVQTQLGLKLEPKKGQIETVVIDKAERSPAEN